MNLAETQHWLGTVLPAECGWKTVRIGTGSAPGFSVTSLFLFDDGSAQPATAPSTTSEEGNLPQVLACTADAARYSSGLISPDGLDVRSEILTVGFGAPAELEQLVAAAATMIAEEGSMRPAQPGTFLPGLGDRVNPALTAKHGLLVVPYIWPQGVPQVREDNTLTSPDGQPLEFTDPGRLTLVVQLIMLTESEFVEGITYGIEALQQKLTETNVDLRDLRR